MTLKIVAETDSWLVETVHRRRVLSELDRLYGVRMRQPARPDPARA
jgi:hypothetical protein